MSASTASSSKRVPLHEGELKRGDCAWALAAEQERMILVLHVVSCRHLTLSFGHPSTTWPPSHALRKSASHHLCMSSNPPRTRQMLLLFQIPLQQHPLPLTLP
jgi:hypothetical protein